MTHIGLIAIIRGVTPDRAAEVGQTIYDAGFRYVEVPLNSPDPLTSIRKLRAALPDDCRVGAGTVVTLDDVHAAASAGAELIVSPNTDRTVISTTIKLGLQSFPGAATPTEAFEAVSAGARSIKLFPGSSIGVSGMKAWASVLPGDVTLIPVGGVTVENLPEWVEGGAHGAGLGASLFHPSMDSPTVAHNALRFMQAWESATSSTNVASASTPL
jgi:2-dehydro-3-deoxyphosphogalactonate aldolase